MKKIFSLFYIFNLILNNFNINSTQDISIENYDLDKNLDVTIIGNIKAADGIGQKSLNFINYFKDKLNLNYIATGNIDEKYLTQETLQILNNNKNKYAPVSILYDLAFSNNIEFIPKNSIIKIAQSVFESTKIPKQWVNNINNHFDAVIVPCHFLIKVYKNCGVRVPIFLLEEGLNLSPFLKSKTKRSQKNKIFTFGMSAGLWPRKNHKALIKCFLKKFKDNPNVKLKLHARGGDEKIMLKIKELIKKNKAENIEFINKELSPSKYLKFMRSLDVYIMISKAEGFSITPRESIALEIPTILSNNTAHKELCKTSYYIPLKSNIKEAADYRWLMGQYYGYNFNFEKQDLEYLLEDVYNNYQTYLENAKLGKKWVKRFTYKSLEKKYLNLIKPEKVILGEKNVIKNNCLITNSKKLYEKYMDLYKLKNS